MTKAPEVHFCNDNSEYAYVVDSTIDTDSKTITAKVPNKLLQESLPLHCYIYLTDSTDETSMKTILHIELPVNKRKKPDDYHYANDDEVISLRDRVIELEQLVQNGDSIYVKKGDQNSGTSCNYTASATGSMSFAAGTLTQSSGSNSFASGSESTASATNAVAFGEKNVASGINSSAHGESTQAQSDNSTTFGYKTVANGFAAIAEGNNTQAISPGSHAAGEGTIASGVSNQFVIGQYNEKDEDGKYLFIIGNGTYDNSKKEETRKNVFTVGKNGSIAGGDNCVASSAPYSFVFGSNNQAYSQYSIIFGDSNATGIQPTDDTPNPYEKPYSIAIGVSCTSKGYISLALGQDCIASGTTSVAMGFRCRADSTMPSYALGHNCESDGQLSLALGQQAYIKGKETIASFALGQTVNVYSSQSLALGGGCIAGTAPTDDTPNPTQGQGNVAMGGGCQATKDCSFALGSGCKSYGGTAFAMGGGSTAYGSNSFALSAATSYGDNSFAFGGGCKSYGVHSFACGGGTESYGDNSFAFGYNVLTRQQNQFAIGKYNTDDQNGEFAFAIGNGNYDAETKTTTRSNAIAIDWQGKIYVNNSDIGVDVLDLLNRVKALEGALDGLKLKKTTTSEYNSLSEKDTNTVYLCTDN